MSKLTLREFLKKYSLLSNEFIDDFNDIYDFNETDNDNFIINLEIIAKWLGSEKGLNSWRISYDFITFNTIYSNKNILFLFKEITSILFN